MLVKRTSMISKFSNTCSVELYPGGSLPEVVIIVMTSSFSNAVIYCFSLTSIMFNSRKYSPNANSIFHTIFVYYYYINTDKSILVFYKVSHFIIYYYLVVLKYYRICSLKYHRLLTVSRDASLVVAGFMKI